MSTSGLDTARIWKERGYDFFRKLPDGRDNVFIVAGYGNVEVFDFLKDEIGMELFSLRNDGLSPLEWAFYKARWEAWAYLVHEYSETEVFEKKCPEIVKRNLEFLVKESKKS